MTCTGQATVCATVGQSVVKRCAISGLPAPDITVQKMSGPASPLPLASSSGLTFSASTLDDRGIYTMIGNNTLQVKRVNVSVQLGVDICGKKKHKVTFYQYLAFVLVAPTVVDVYFPDPIVCSNLILVNYAVSGIPTPRVTWGPLLGERTVVRSPIESKNTDRVTSIVTSTLEIRAERTDTNSSICAEATNEVIPITSTRRCFTINVTCKNSSYELKYLV